MLVAILAPFLAMAQPADAGPDVMVCGDQYDMLANTPAPPGSGVWTLISGCGFLMNNTDPNTHMYGLCPGSSVWRWSTVDASGTQTSDIVEVISFDANALPADAGQDVTVIGLPNMVQLNASPDPIPPMTCYWTIVSGTGNITDPSVSNPYATDLAIGTSVFRWTCDNGPCGTTYDHVSIQFMMVTGIGTTIQDAAQLFRYDPRAQQLVIDGTKTIDGLMITDALGRSMPLSLGGSNTRTWNVAEYPSGLYVLRAQMDGRPHVYRFVVER